MVIERLKREKNLNEGQKVRKNRSFLPRLETEGRKLGLSVKESGKMLSEKDMRLGGRYSREKQVEDVVLKLRKKMKKVVFGGSHEGKGLVKSKANQSISGWGKEVALW